MIVIGTGTDIRTDGIGSMPKECVALQMSHSPPMIDKMKTALTKHYGDRAAALVSAFERHDQAQHLICNPSLCGVSFQAACGFLWPAKNSLTLRFSLRQRRPSRPWTSDCECARLQALERNGESQQKRSSALLQGCAGAASARCGRASDLTEEERALRIRQGVLTECSLWVPLNFVATNRDFVMVTGTKHLVEDENGDMVERYLAAPRTGKYAMSIAQQLLFGMVYGFHVLETAVSWERYEVMIAEQATVLLSGLEGRTLSALLGRLGTHKKGAKKCVAAPAKKTIKQKKATGQHDTAIIKQETAVSHADAIPEAIALAKELCFDNVITVHSKKQIVSTTSPKEIESLFQECMSNEEGPATDVANTAVVIVNGASAKYADVIVVIPCHAVILIQCKSFYSDESSFAIEEEANKSLR